MIGLPRLYAIADASFGDPVRLSTQLFEGGATLIQLRNKEAAANAILAQAEAIKKNAPAGAVIVINDRADIALISRASGVHIGQGDLPPELARRVLGRERLVGLSTHSESQALHADQLPVDYIAFGPIFSTSTKRNSQPPVGLERLSEVCRLVRKPVVAIGGITLESALDVLAAGAQSVAVISDILRAPDVAARTSKFVCKLIDHGAGA